MELHRTSVKAPGKSLERGTNCSSSKVSPIIRTALRHKRCGRDESLEAKGKNWGEFDEESILRNGARN